MYDYIDYSKGKNLQFPSMLIILSLSIKISWFFKPLFSNTSLYINNTINKLLLYKRRKIRNFFFFLFWFRILIHKCFCKGIKLLYFWSTRWLWNHKTINQFILIDSLNIEYVDSFLLILFLSFLMLNGVLIYWIISIFKN